MADGSGNLPMPPLAATPVKKSHVALFVAGVAIVGVLWMMGVGSGASDGGIAGASGGGSNPLIGKWNLVDVGDAAFCPTTEEFTASTNKWTQNGTKRQMKPIYDIQPGGQKVTVGYGGSYIGNWTVDGPDDLTLGQVGPPPYGVPSFCKYHRM